MTVTGIICEYNPLHLGHRKQLELVRSAHPDGAIVCLMSGHYVQRGHPAILHKALRAKAAVDCGADLVLENPVTAVLRSAEGYADAGVSILSPFCDTLCFGAECGDEKLLTQIADVLRTPEFSEKLRIHLDRGVSFPAARQAALAELGMDGAILTHPNNILAVEYCKAIARHGGKLKPMVIRRAGGYHDTLADRDNPSATAVRERMLSGGCWQELVPNICEGVTLHTLDAGQRAVLGKLRTMTEADFAALPHGSEGLWRKLMHAAKAGDTLESIATQVKSKRYTRTRIDRMILCAFLGISQQQLLSPVPYVRVLALSARGRRVLNDARKTGAFPNIGQRIDDPYQKLEDRCGDLYGLFARDLPEKADQERSLRVYCK